MWTETACRMSCLLKRKGESLASLREHLSVFSIILAERVLCKVTPAMPTWGSSPEDQDIAPPPALPRSSVQGCLMSHVQGLLEIKDTHRPQWGPMFLRLALP